MTALPLTLPPIVERELRIASRRSATYWGRTGAAISGSIIVCWVTSAQLAAGPKLMAGQITFRLLACIAAFIALTGVLQFSAEAFAREKREDTLGLLFLTPLRPIDLVIGKLVSTSLNAFYRFLAIIPLLAIPVLLGGVTARNLALLVLGLVNTVFLGATIGLYVSARSWDEKRALSVASFVTPCLVFVPVLAFILAAVTRKPGLASLFAISPAYAIWESTFPRPSNPALFWASLGWTQILGWIFFFATCRTLPRCWQNRPVSLAPAADHLQRADTTSTPGTGTPARNGAKQIRRSVRRHFSSLERTSMLKVNPIFWLASRWKPFVSAAWIVGALGLVVVVVLMIADTPKALISPILALLVCYCVNAGFKLSASTYASQAFSLDRGEDRLELLLSTPITAREMIRGHVLALNHTLRPWIRRTLWIEVAWLAFTLSVDSRLGKAGTILCVIASLAIVGFLVPDLHAIGWSALSRSLTAQRARDAEHEANQQVLVLPWLPSALVWVVMQGLAGSYVAAIALIVSWTTFSAVANWWFSRRARHNLETRLVLWAQRRAAGELEHYDSWRNLGRRLGRWWRMQRAAGKT